VGLGTFSAVEAVRHFGFGHRLLLSGDAGVAAVIVIVAWNGAAANTEATQRCGLTPRCKGCSSCLVTPLSVTVGPLARGVVGWHIKDMDRADFLARLEWNKQIRVRFGLLAANLFLIVRCSVCL